MASHQFAHKEGSFSIVMFSVCLVLPLSVHVIINNITDFHTAPVALLLAWALARPLAMNSHNHDTSKLDMQIPGPLC